MMPQPVEDTRESIADIIQIRDPADIEGYVVIADLGADQRRMACAHNCAGTEELISFLCEVIRELEAAGA